MAAVSQSSQNALFLSFCEDCDHNCSPQKMRHGPHKMTFLSQSSQKTTIMSRNSHISVAIISRLPVHWHRMIPNAFQI